MSQIAFDGSSSLAFVGSPLLARNEPSTPIGYFNVNILWQVDSDSFLSSLSEAKTALNQIRQLLAQKAKEIVPEVDGVSVYYRYNGVTLTLSDSTGFVGVSEPARSSPNGSSGLTLSYIAALHRWKLEGRLSFNNIPKSSETWEARFPACLHYSKSKSGIVTRSCILPRVTASTSSSLGVGYKYRITDTGPSIIYETNGADENLFTDADFAADGSGGRAMTLYQNWTVTSHIFMPLSPPCCDLSPL